MSNAEKKRAPTASEALRAAKEGLMLIGVGSVARGLLDQHIAAAERAEAEEDGCQCMGSRSPSCPQHSLSANSDVTDGESVEALMRECYGVLLNGGTLTVWPEGCDGNGRVFKWVVGMCHSAGAQTIERRPSLKEALAALRDKLRAASSPSAPDYEKMGWEELEALLPRGADIMVGASCYVVVVGGRPRGKGKTRIAAVRAYLREHGGGAA